MYMVEATVGSKYQFTGFHKSDYFLEGVLEERVAVLRPVVVVLVPLVRLLPERVVVVVVVPLSLVRLLPVRVADVAVPVARLLPVRVAVLPSCPSVFSLTRLVPVLLRVGVVPVLRVVVPVRDSVPVLRVVVPVLRVSVALPRVSVLREGVAVSVARELPLRVEVPEVAVPLDEGRVEGTTPLLRGPPWVPLLCTCGCSIPGVQGDEGTGAGVCGVRI